MADTIDVHDLSDDEVKFIQEFVEFLREKMKMKKIKAEKKEAEEITFATHRSDVIGKLTRREIYDYL